MELKTSYRIPITKGVLQSEALYDYIMETTVFPHEAESLKELRDATASHPWSGMSSSPDAAKLMSMLLKLVNAKKTIEVGVFTGYSLLLTALTIPRDGKPENEGSFDFAYVDADKDNYLNYHERLLKLVKIGGVIIYDNTLWQGTVAMPEETVTESLRSGRKFALALNKALASDPRVQMSHVPVGDGNIICIRIQ